MITNNKQEILKIHRKESSKVQPGLELIPPGHVSDTLTTEPSGHRANQLRAYVSLRMIYLVQVNPMTQHKSTETACAITHDVYGLG